MNEESKTPDYSCEIIGLAVLLILSAVSHFWYVAMVAGVGAGFWGLIRLANQVVQSTSGTRVRARQTD